MSTEHFSVDSTLIEAWASLKSFRSKDDDDLDSNSWSGFRGERRSNQTHESKTDPEAKLYRKGYGKEARMSFMAHALMENRNGLIADILVSSPTGRSERDSALVMIARTINSSQPTLGADAGYATKDFVENCRNRGITPHVASKKYSVVDRRTTRHCGYSASQRIRKRSEQIFGWLKCVGGLRKTRFKGRAKNQLLAYMAGAAYNLLRIAKWAPSFS